MIKILIKILIMVCLIFFMYIFLYTEIGRIQMNRLSYSNCYLESRDKANRGYYP